MRLRLVKILRPVISVDIKGGRITSSFSELSSISAARPISDSTIEITTHKPDPMLPKKLSLMRIVDFTTWSTIGADNYSKEPIGTGPFFLKSWNDREFGIGLKNFFDAIAFIFDVPKVTVCRSGPSTGLPMTPISAS